MATATNKSRAAKQSASHPVDERNSASMDYRVFQDNGGAYRWTIAAADGATLAQSGSFASRDDAEAASENVRDGEAVVTWQARP